jgi:HTH-type transcriptional repressor of NAD biosynthesis genes
LEAENHKPRLVGIFPLVHEAHTELAGPEEAVEIALLDEPTVYSLAQRKEWLRHLWPLATITVSASSDWQNFIGWKWAEVPAHWHPHWALAANAASFSSLNLLSQAVSQSPKEHWNMLGEKVRASLQERIVLFGPESTGKSTLGLALAAHFKTSCVPEFARYYLSARNRYLDPFGRSPEVICQPQDIPTIVLGQISAEDSLVLQSGPILLCDTNPLQSQVYNLLYFGREERWLEAIIEERRYHHYLLLAPDFPWVPDPPLRDQPAQRDAHYLLFKDALIKRGFSFTEISGSQEDRLLQAVQAIEAL